MQRVNNNYWFWLLLVSGIGVTFIYQHGLTGFFGIAWLLLLIVCIPAGVAGLIKQARKRTA